MMLETVFQHRYKLASVLGRVCLALMLVVLGAVAKNSQFQAPAHSSHYLKQSVKMVSGQDDTVVLSPPAPSVPLLTLKASLPKVFRIVASQPHQNPFTPLLL